MKYPTPNGFSPNSVVRRQRKVGAVVPDRDGNFRAFYSPWWGKYYAKSQQLPGFWRVKQ